MFQGEFPPEGRFVLLPAAGLSQRMGKHKLSLPLGESTLLGQVLENYLAAAIDLIVLIRRPGDDALVDALPTSDRLLLVTPSEAPADMKASLGYGLAALESFRKIRETDLFLLSPPDMPLLEPSLLDYLLEEWFRGQQDVLIPTYQAKRGHPVLFSGRIAELISEIRVDEGLNALWRRDGIRLREMELGIPEILFDVDTPEEYAEARKRLG
ncbi:MAG: nucleotidyltransferase family protein [Planctomycetaceae bacterium]